MKPAGTLLVNRLCSHVLSGKQMNLESSGLSHPCSLFQRMVGGFCTEGGVKRLGLFTSLDDSLLKNQHKWGTREPTHKRAWLENEKESFSLSFLLVPCTLKPMKTLKAFHCCLEVVQQPSISAVVLFFPFWNDKPLGIGCPLKQVSLFFSTFCAKGKSKDQEVILESLSKSCSPYWLLEGQPNRP